MLRCTIELVPQGDESRIRTIGCIEIANVGGTSEMGEYVVVLKKTPPFTGALKAAWKKGTLVPIGKEDDEIISGAVVGHHRQKRGPYDLLYRALRACGLEARNS